MNEIPTISYDQSDPEIEADNTPIVLPEGIFMPCGSIRLGFMEGDSIVRVMMDVPDSPCGLFAPLTVKAMTGFIDQMTAVRDQILAQTAKQAGAAIAKAAGQ